MGAVLCSLLGLPCLRVGTLLACGVYCASSLRSLQSWLPFVFGPPSHSVCPSPALAVGWFGHRSVAPPAAPVVGSLLRRSVALGSCAPYPVGSSLADSYGFVVHAFGVFLDSFLSLPVVTDGLGWLLPALRAGSPTYGWRCVLRRALVLVAVPPSLRLVLRIRTGFLFYGPGVRVGFNCLLLLCIPSGCGHPLGQLCLCHS